ncbi:MAG TPA: hypothetical protein VF715_09080 [Thermoleophilaceae bacterium]
MPLLALIAAIVAVCAPQAMAADTMLVNATDERPAGVDAKRLYDLSDEAASRWKMSVVGNSSAEPGVRDSQQVIGFSRKTNPQALGVTSVWTRTRYKVKTVRTCTRVRGKKRCRNVKKYVRDGVDVIERDIQLNPFVRWEQGPAYPDAEEYDLESTILHEVGHFANPTKDNHVFGCENSPMIDAISPGEFWRDADNWLRYGCSASSGPKYRPVVPAGPRMRMLVVEHRLP